MNVAALFRALEISVALRWQPERYRSNYTCLLLLKGPLNSEVGRGVGENAGSEAGGVER
jgi:hypothetical protein